MDTDRIHLEPLRQYQYKQVAEWEYGPQDGVDWPRYYAEMNAPQWKHYGLYQSGLFIGCISLEHDRGSVAFHVVTARRRVKPGELAQVLLKKAGELFDHGYTALAARIPVKKRAAARLAIRCGMREWGKTEEVRLFILTKSRYQRNGQLEAD